MASLINANADQGLMLSRSPGELYESLRDFLVIEGDPGALLACVAVHVFTGEIAELKSLAVSDQARGQGMGRKLVAAACTEALSLGLAKIFCLTYQRDFFLRCGFVLVDRSQLPEKVWGECVRCQHFLDCDEIAMWRNLGQDAAPS